MIFFVDVVAEGYGVEACFHEFVVEVWGEAGAVGCVFCVCDDEVGVVLIAQVWDCLCEGLTAWCANDVAEENDSHSRRITQLEVLVN